MGMIIGNATLFLDGAFVPGSLTVEGERIAAIGPADAPCDVDAEGRYLVPGFVDVHTHGAMGGDVSDGEAQGLLDMSRHFARHGVTSFLATTMTLGEDTLTNAMHAIRDFRRPADGARIAGIHLEGPFLSYAKRGAQAAEHLHAPDYALLCRLNEESGGLVRLVTVAPEEAGAMDFIAQASQLCTVSLGHTSAGYDTAMEAFHAGASHVTHLYNGMPSLLHREPGVVGAARDSGATVELICDGLHIHPSVIRATQAMFGEKLVIISDSLRCAGMPDGEYVLGGQPIVMRGGKATLLDGTLAGSSSALLEEVGKVISFGLRLEDALTAVTLAPAKAVGLDGEIGSLTVGKRADLLLLDSNLALHAVYIGGSKLIMV